MRITLELACGHFARLIEAAKDEVPTAAKHRIGELEASLAQARSEVEASRCERDDARAIVARMESLCAAAIRWRKDRYTPRLEIAVDSYLREEVLRR